MTSSTYLLHIDDHHLTLASQVLQSAGIAFLPSRDLVLVNEDADIDYLCTPRDLPHIIEALNLNLERHGDPRRITAGPETLSLNQMRSLMEIGHSLMSWSGKTPVDDTPIDQSGGIPRLIAPNYRELLSLLG